MNSRDELVLVLGSVDLVELEIFKAVAELGGVTKAAARLHRVQSNVTTRVKQLEARLGTALFLRQHRRLVLSPEGKVLLAYADRLLRLSAEAAAAVQSRVPRGPFRLGTLESTAATRLPPLLARYHRRHPDVRVDLVTGTTGALVARVGAREIEAAFVAEPFTATGLDSEPVFQEELVLVAPPRLARIRTPRDIGPATLIAFTTGCSYRRRLEAWLRGTRIVPERIMEFGSYHAIVACVAAGTGIAVVPRSVLRTVPAARNVAVHALPPAVAKARTHLAWRHGETSPALEALRAEVRRTRR